MKASKDKKSGMPKDWAKRHSGYDGTGMVHSLESFGAVDGPGLRCVVFLEGCPLRCAYCSNKDMLDLKDYQTMTPQKLLELVKPFKPYIGKNGGVTISGGDPVFQPEFVLEFLKLCKQEDLHTAIDTSLFTTREVIDMFLPYTDLFMVSLKHFDTATHKKLTGVDNHPILENLQYLSYVIGKKKNGPKLWFRYVVLPTYTDTNDNLGALIDFLSTMNFEQIELLPYHTLGKYKWEKLGIKYPLGNLETPKTESVVKIRKRLEKNNIKVVTYE